MGLNDTRDNEIAGPHVVDKEHAQHIQNDRSARRDPPESQPRTVSGGGKSFADISDLPGNGGSGAIAIRGARKVECG